VVHGPLVDSDTRVKVSRFYRLSDLIHTQYTHIIIIIIIINYFNWNDTNFFDFVMKRNLCVKQNHVKYVTKNVKSWVEILFIRIQIKLFSYSFLGL